jgi:hypothetical protein
MDGSKGIILGNLLIKLLSQWQKWRIKLFNVLFYLILVERAMQGEEDAYEDEEWFYFTTTNKLYLTSLLIYTDSLFF